MELVGTMKPIAENLDAKQGLSTNYFKNIYMEISMCVNESKRWPERKGTRKVLRKEARSNKPWASRIQLSRSGKYKSVNRIVKGFLHINLPWQ